MTQEDKELLLKDLCCRLPYGIKIARGQYEKNSKNVNSISIVNIGIFLNGYFNKGIQLDFNGNKELWPKPYLRPMSSMTDEEKGELWFLLTEGRTNIELNSNGQLTTRENIELGFNYPFVCPEGSTLYVDWLNAHHFDYRKLIEKGLAIEAPEGMYKIE